MPNPLQLEYLLYINYVFLLFNREVLRLLLPHPRHLLEHPFDPLVRYVIKGQWLDLYILYLCAPLHLNKLHLNWSRIPLLLCIESPYVINCLTV